jgi:hypothetical protein
VSQPGRNDKQVFNRLLRRFGWLWHGCVCDERKESTVDESTRLACLDTFALWIDKKREPVRKVEVQRRGSRSLWVAGARWSPWFGVYATTFEFCIRVRACIRGRNQWQGRHLTRENRRLFNSQEQGNVVSGWDDERWKRTLRFERTCGCLEVWWVIHSWHRTCVEVLVTGLDAKRMFGQVW